MAIQNSEYICIDHELMDKNQFQINSEDKTYGKFQMKEFQYSKTKSLLNIKFCHSSEIQREAYEFIRFKATFGQK